MSAPSEAAIAAARICPLSTQELVGKILHATERLVNVELYSYQRVFVIRVVESLLANDGATITALWSRQCGKSTAVALMSVGLIVWLPLLANLYPDDDRLSSFVNGFRIGVFAPVEDQARETFDRMREVFDSEHALEILGDPEIEIEVLVNRGDRIKLSNGSQIRCRTASDDSNIEGKTYDLVICVAGDTEIETPDGVRRIQDLVESGYAGTVRALDHATGQVVWAQVLDRQRIVGAGDAYELTFDNGQRVVATGDHLWWIDGLGYVETREVYRLRGRAVQSNDGRSGDGAGNTPRGFESPASGEGFTEPATGGESQLEADRVCAVQGGEAGGGAAEDRGVPEPWEGEYVGEAAYEVQPPPTGVVVGGVRYWSEVGDGGLAREADGRVPGVLVDGRRIAGREPAESLHARVQCDGARADLRVVLGDRVPSEGDGAQADYREEPSVSSPRVRGHERDGGGVRVPFDGVQVRADEACGLRHLRGDVHPVPGDGLEPLLFVGVMSAGETPETRRLQGCRRVQTPEVVYDLTTTTGNFFAGGVLSHNCEEAQKISKTQVDKAIRPMLASTNGTMIKIGTAWQSRGGFHNDIQQNVIQHRKGGTRNHFEIPYNVVIREKQARWQEERRLYDEETELLTTGKITERTRPAPRSFHLKYEKFVQAEIKRIGGTDAIEFKMNFRLLWAESRVIAVDPITLARAAIPEMESSRGPVRMGFQVAGLDLGKQNDKTVLTVGTVDYDMPIRHHVAGPEADPDNLVVYPKTIQDWMCLEGAFEGEDGQYETLVEYIRFTGVKVLVVDATGLAGDVIFERLQVLIGESVVLVPFVFNMSTKSNGYKHYLQELKSGRVGYPAGPRTRETFEYQQFVKEHEDLEREVAGNFVLIHAPDDDEAAHDDFPDSAMLFCHAAKVAPEVIMPEIEEYDGGGSSRRSGVGRSDGGGSRYRRR